MSYPVFSSLLLHLYYLHISTNKFVNIFLNYLGRYLHCCLWGSHKFSLQVWKTYCKMAKPCLMTQHAHGHQHSCALSIGRAIPKWQFNVLSRTELMVAGFHEKGHLSLLLAVFKHPDFDIIYVYSKCTYWGNLKFHFSVLTSFIKFNKTLTKFNEALTKPYHGLIEFYCKLISDIIVNDYTAKRN